METCYLCGKMLELNENLTMECPRGCEEKFFLENEDRILDEMISRNGCLQVIS